MRRRHPVLPVLLLGALLAVALLATRSPAGAGTPAGDAGPVAAAPVTGARAWLAAAGRSSYGTPLRMAAGGLRVAVVRRQVLAARRLAARRRAEARRLAGTRSVRGAVRRAWLLGAIDRRTHDRHRRTWRDAERAAGRLPGRRGAEMRGVLRDVASIARARRLTPSRLPAAMLLVERNTRFWTSRPLPAPSERVSFGRDPVVFQAVPGHGLAVHPLATWGRVNGFARDCARRRARCDRDRLDRALDRLTRLAARRGGGLAWEYLHRYGAGAPPWVSGMAQATAIQALARGARATGARRHLATARAALGVFEQRPPTGVAVPARGGTHFLMYSFDPGLRVLNGFLQSVTGLRDLAVLGGSRRARTLYRRGEAAARAAVDAFDTGAWSLYSLGGREATLGYHVLQRSFLANLCRRTGRRAYCAAQKRFVRYEREPPRIDVGRPRRVRVGRATTLTFRLSKVADVAVRAGGRTLTRARLPRGTHTLRWTPPRRGAQRVEVAVVGLSGPRGVAARTVVVRPPRPVARRAGAG